MTTLLVLLVAVPVLLAGYVLFLRLAEAASDVHFRFTPALRSFGVTMRHASASMRAFSYALGQQVERDRRAELRRRNER